MLLRADAFIRTLKKRSRNRFLATKAHYAFGK
jgi:hypothetical protein